MARRGVRVDDGVDDVAGQRTSSGGDYRARRGDLDNSGAAKRLRGALAAAVRQHLGRVLLDPGRDPAEAADVCEGCCRHREERRGRGALELPAAHFAP